ncbi:MAG: lytic transglycosylase domain-containing protein [Neisseria sp.]|nr:lytic transglycosylase domain-containing protein [Neisseria sp.]
MKKYLFILLLQSIPITVAAQKLTFPQYAALVEKHAALQGLDKNLIWAVIGRESSGNPNALSHKDARGLMQVIPTTAERMGVKRQHLYDPEQNIIAGTRYLRYLTKYFKGNLDLILAGYNAGEGAVLKYKGVPPYRETREYVKNVKYRYARLSGNAAYAANPQTMQSAKAEPHAVASASVTVNSSKNEEANQAQQTTQVVLKRKHESWDVFQEF